MERVILNGAVRRSEGYGGNIVILRFIVILNEVKDLKCVTGSVPDSSLALRMTEKTF